MTDAFLSYSEDFEQYRDDAANDIKELNATNDKAARSELVERARNNISEAERYMRILESESRAGDSQERRKMHQQLRSFKSHLDKLKSNLERAKLIDDSRQRLNDRPDNLSAKDNMIRYQQRLDRTEDHLHDAQALIAQSEATAQNISSNLGAQREHLINVRTNVDEAREDTREAGQHLTSLKRKVFSKIVMLYFIIFGLTVAIIWKIIHTIT